MSYQKTFRLGQKEMTRFYWNRMLRNRLVRMILIGLTGGLAFTVYSFENAEPARLVLIFLMGSWVSFAAAVGIHYMVAVNQGRNSRVYQQDVTVNGFGFTVNANGVERRVPFEKIYAVRETAADIFIYANREDAWILCKDQMDDPAADCAALRALFRQVIPSGSLHLKG